MSWYVLKNGKFIGIIESNYPWASGYWAAQCKHGVIYSLKQKG